MLSADVNAQVEAGLTAVRLPKNIDLAKDLAPGLPDIPCTALDLAIENLLNNAITAMRDQPGTLTVTTRSTSTCHGSPSSRSPWGTPARE